MDLSIIERRQKKAMQHLGQTAKVGSRSYPCYPAAMRDNQLRNRDQTFRENYQTSIAIIAGDVTVSIGDRVTYAGAELRVLDTGETGDGLQRILHLGNLFGGN